MLRYFGSVTYLCTPPLGRWGDILAAFELNTSLDSTLVLIKRTPKNSQEHDTCSSLMDTNLLPSFRRVTWSDVTARWLRPSLHCFQQTYTARLARIFCWHPK